jgi:hypothetical protein
VEPGDYHVSIVQDSYAQQDHWFLESEADYPPGDGPAWVIRLSRLPAISKDT